MDRAWGGWFVAALRSVRLRWSWSAWLTHIPGRVLLAIGWEGAVSQGPELAAHGCAGFPTARRVRSKSQRPKLHGFF